MAEREQKKKQAPARQDEEVVEEAPATSEKGEALKAELDALVRQRVFLLRQSA